MTTEEIRLERQRILELDWLHFWISRYAIGRLVQASKSF